MPAYKAPLREFRYVLHEVLGAHGPLPRARARRHQRRTDRGRPRRARRALPRTWSRRPTRRGDRVGVRRMEDGRVVTPPGFVEAYRQYVDDGWAALCGPVEAGGQGLPESIGGVVGEMFVSANMSWKLYSGLTDSAVLCLDKRGTEEMRRIYLPKLVSGVWSGTMVLTEAARGHRSRPHAHARRAGRPGRSTAITGTKIFITSGEHDLTENIIHLVLAKLPGRARGLARHQHVPGAEVPARRRGQARRGEWRQLRERRAQARHPRLGHLRDELRQCAGLADRRGQRRPQEHVHDDESRAALGRAAGTRPVRARIPGLARLRARAPPGPHFGGRQGTGRPDHRASGRAPHAADAEIADRGRAHPDLLRGHADGHVAASPGRRARASRPRPCCRS